MIYLFAIALTLLFSMLKWDVDPVLLQRVALLPLAYIFFADSIRIRYQPLIKYHILAPCLAATSLLFFYVLGSSASTCGWTLVLLALSDTRTFPGIRHRGLVPARISQLLSIDGAFRTALLVIVLSLTQEHALYEVALPGVLLIGLSFVLVYFNLTLILFLVPLFAVVPFSDSHLLPLLVVGLCGSLLGNCMRMQTKVYLQKINKLYPPLFLLALISFTLFYAHTLLQEMSWSVAFIACALFFAYLVFAFAAFGFLGMRMETAVFYATASIPGIAPFSLAVLLSDYLGAIPHLLLVLFVLHNLLLPRALTSYGKFFTGRDPYSSLKEHGAVVELPL